MLGDVRDGPALLRAAEGVDAVVHLAALVAPRPAWSDAYAVNVGGTANALAAAAPSGRLVHVSSPSVAFDGGPAVGVGAGPAAYAGDDVYTRTKAVAERIVLAQSAVPTVVLRPHLVWGPGDTQLVGRIVDRARQGRLALPDHGRALVDTTYVDDAAAAVVAGLDRTADSERGRREAVGGHRRRSSPARRVGRRDPVGRRATAAGPLGARAGRRAGRTADRTPLAGRSSPRSRISQPRQLSVAHWFDQAETRRVLRWSPRVGVDEGLARLAASYATA